MKIKVKTVSSQTFTITLSPVELVHVEAACDAFAQFGAKRAAGWMGMYAEHWDKMVMDHVLLTLNTMREKVKLPPK